MHNIKKKIIVSVTNDLITDYRVYKVCDFLSAKYDIELIGLKSSYNKHYTQDYKITLIKCFFKKNFFFYAEFNIKLFFILLFRRADIFLSNDLDTLLPNYLVSVLRKKNIVYDSHEYFTETPELYNRLFVKRIWSCIESLILPKLKKTYTVSKSISDIYSAKYNIRMAVLRNIPIKLDLNNINKRLHKRDYIIYQGSINNSRGLRYAIKAISLIKDLDLLIIGNGIYKDKLKKYVQGNNFTNILFIDKMPFEKLIFYTKHAKLGILFEEPKSMSFKYSLPNKLFDYINAEIPIISSELEEVKGIINNYNIGEFINSYESTYLAKKIQSMIKSDKYKYWIDNCKKAKLELCWEKESKKLDSIFNF